MQQEKRKGAYRMRTLEEIETDLALAREALSHAEGTPAEVYSRIVGYYRSVRNWNKGKREEYGERKPFFAPETSAVLMADTITATSPAYAAGSAALAPLQARAAEDASPFDPATRQEEDRLLLFVRPACPRCPGAKEAAGRLGIPVDLVNADTEDGMAEAVRRQVFSTPTAILLARDGRELGRALDAGSISRLTAVAVAVAV
jgi:ribonucleoside-triphosphate reductase